MPALYLKWVVKDVVWVDKSSESLHSITYNSRPGFKGVVIEIGWLLAY
jgi:hypothetical protein